MGSPKVSGSPFVAPLPPTRPAAAPDAGRPAQGTEAPATAAWTPGRQADPATGFSATLSTPVNVTLDANGQTGKLRFDLPLDSIKPPLPASLFKDAKAMRVMFPPGNNDVIPFKVATVNGKPVVQISASNAEVSTLRQSGVQIAVGDPASLKQQASVVRANITVKPSAVQVDSSAPTAALEKDQAADQQKYVDGLKSDLADMKAGKGNWFQPLTDAQAKVDDLTQKVKTAQPQLDATIAQSRADVSKVSPMQAAGALPLSLGATRDAAVNTASQLGTVRGQLADLDNERKVAADANVPELVAELDQRRPALADQEKTLSAQLDQQLGAARQELQKDPLGEARWLADVGQLSGGPPVDDYMRPFIDAQANREDLSYAQSHLAQVQVNTNVAAPARIKDLEAQIADGSARLKQLDSDVEALSDGKRKQLSTVKVSPQ